MLPGKELKHNDTFPRNNREVNETNESREELDYSVTYLLLLAFCYLQIGNLKWNLLSKVHYEENEYKPYQIYYLYKYSRMR